MIQRIQTVFLFIIVILQTLMFLIPFGQLITADGIVGVKVSSSLTTMVLTFITSVVAAISIFMYKKRPIQMRMNIFNGVILLVVQGYIIYHLITIGTLFETIKPTVIAIFPLISAILTFLAVRSIWKDELLVKAFNRIR